MAPFKLSVIHAMVYRYGVGGVRVITLALVAGLFFHSFNGVRIILIDFWPKAVRIQRAMFVIVMILTVLCFIGIGWFIIAPIFGVNLGNTASGM